MIFRVVSKLYMIHIVGIFFLINLTIPFTLRIVLRKRLA